jgi:hypothetical protein
MRFLRFKKIRFLLIPVILLMGGLVFGTGHDGPKKTKLPAHKDSSVTALADNNRAFLYDSLDLDGLGLSKEAFNLALTGYQTLLEAGKVQKDNILTIIDFSLPSSQKRLFVIDLSTGALLFNTFVSHGRNSGTALASKFSNAFNSFKSSLGFYTTGSPYSGKHGYSLRLEGQEAGINDNAMERGIVMHSADYVNERTIHQMGYLGRSQGCPAIPEALKKPIIETIRNGSCLFVYSPDKSYTAHSKLLQKGSI